MLFVFKVSLKSQAFVPYVTCRTDNDFLEHVDVCLHYVLTDKNHIEESCLNNYIDDPETVIQLVYNMYKLNFSR